MFSSLGFFGVFHIKDINAKIFLFLNSTQFFNEVFFAPQKTFNLVPIFPYE